jgi:hypothetical protein
MSRVFAIVDEHELGRCVAKSPGNHDRGKYKPATNARTTTTPIAIDFHTPLRGSPDEEAGPSGES